MAQVSDRTVMRLLDKQIGVYIRHCLYYLMLTNPLSRCRIADVDPKVQTEYAKLLYSINPFYTAFQRNEYSDTLYEDIRVSTIDFKPAGLSDC